MPETCPSCDDPLDERDAMYHWRGRYFSGLVCPNCNALWPVGDGHRQFVEAVRASAGVPDAAAQLVAGIEEAIRGCDLYIDDCLSRAEAPSPIYVHLRASLISALEAYRRTTP